MRHIGDSIRKVDNYDKAAGLAKYVADCRADHMLFASMVRSGIAHGRIRSISYPQMEEGYDVVDCRDAYSSNYLRNAEDGQRIFAVDEVNYVGEGIALICGPDREKTRRYARETRVEYEELPIVESPLESDTVQLEYRYRKQDIDRAFAEADREYAETFQAGYQEHLYLETNGMLAAWEDGRMKVYGSMQNPYYVKNELAAVMGLDPEQVEVIQTVTGGGFGGKEDYPSLVACQAAYASYKLKRPVLFVLGRKEDIHDSPKRHPCVIRYRAALDKENRITGIDADVVLDGGAYQTVSATVMQRCLITITGVYDIPNLKVHGRVMMTNRAPTGAFRGFGAPQSHYAIETFMQHLAGCVGEDPLAFKRKHLVRQGSLTATSGRYHYLVIVPEMIDRAAALTDYTRKRETYRNQTGRFRRGIGMGLFIHGCGFTGSAEKDFLKSVAAVRKYPDGKVEVLASSTDIGQGVKTTYVKIVAETLGLPTEQVFIVNPDTDRVPNSGPTVASRSIMIVGNLLQKG